MVYQRNKGSEKIVVIEKLYHDVMIPFSIHRGNIIDAKKEKSNEAS